jgi:hypothetical protein
VAFGFAPAVRGDSLATARSPVEAVSQARLETERRMGGMWFEVGSLDREALEVVPSNCKVLPDTAVKGALLGVASRGILPDVDPKGVLLLAPPKSVVLDEAPKDETVWAAGDDRTSLP